MSSPGQVFTKSCINEDYSEMAESLMLTDTKSIQLLFWKRIMKKKAKRKSLNSWTKVFILFNIYFQEIIPWIKKLCRVIVYSGSLSSSASDT